MQTKFWNKISSSEIYIYGDIVSQNYFDSDVTAKKFADDLISCDQEVTLHINSNGGDVFEALAISNLISQSPKNITASIDGICASAATLISCACNKVIMTENSLMMIHLPSVFLSDFFDAIQLAKIESSLNKVRDTLLNAYNKRTGLNIEDLNEMISKETWLSAEEARELNFADEVSGASDIEIDNANRTLIFNSVALKKNYFDKVKEKLKMEQETQSILNKIKNLLKGEKNSDTKSDAEIQDKIRAAEVARIQNLNALRCDNEFVNALIDVAISEGRNLSEVKNYIEALKKVQPKNDVGKQILDLIEDNLQSGASEIICSDELNPNAGNKLTADLIAKFANASIS